MINIYEEQLSLDAVRYLQRKDHQITDKVKTIKQLLDYFLFSFSLRVFLVERKVDKKGSIIRYDLLLQDLDPNRQRAYEDQSKPYEKQCYIGATDDKTAFTLGIQEVVSYIQYNRNRDSSIDYIEKARIRIELFHDTNTALNVTRWFELKDALALHLSKRQKHLPFNFKGINVLPKLAEAILEYAKFMLDIDENARPVEEPIDLVGMDEASSNSWPINDPTIAVDASNLDVNYDPNGIRTTIPGAHFDTDGVLQPGVGNSTFEVNFNGYVSGIDPYADPSNAEILQRTATILGRQPTYNEAIAILQANVDTNEQLRNPSMIDLMRPYQDSQIIAMNSLNRVLAGDVSMMNPPTIREMSERTPPLNQDEIDYETH